MTDVIEVKVPDIGDFTDVEVIEVHVKAGDEVAAEDSLITLETEKAAMDVPVPSAGRVEEIFISVGDKVSEGTVIIKLTAADSTVGLDSAAPAEVNTSSQTEVDPKQVAIPPNSYTGKADNETSLLILGAGPGGYTAAFRAADLGMDVTLVERWPSLGGVCLNVGCIPSKALLHAAKVIEEAHEMSEFGVKFAAPEINTIKLRDWKQSVVDRLTGGLAGLAKQRKVKVVQGTGTFLSPQHVRVEGDTGSQVIAFQQCIIAAGSEPAMIPGLPDDPRIIDSSGALELEDMPKRMLVIGGGIIGLEMATVYDALGVQVSVVELTKTLVPGCDPDLLRPLEKRIKGRYEAIYKGVGVTGVAAEKAGLLVSFEGNGAPEPQLYDKVLVAVGRSANGGKIGAELAGVKVSERGIIDVDKQQRTNVPHIFAIGDIVGQPMLAHKATHEGKVAAEVAAGEKSYFDARVIPGVAYTDPEIAWVGVTETEAKAQGLDYGKGAFPWAASGRALSVARDEGVTKIIFDNKTNKIIGCGIVGPNAGELIAEACLAIEMGCDATDIGLTIHPHPTLSETVGMAAEAFEGTLTDLYIPKRKK
ncbi:MAG: dihydrolipoyl dehydrogenase [Gammaproteobacteria bacterium]|nr:dihydrolipoyl dehydrogenase [Gammaproteobacteria bacterium]MCP4091049.1 dihydrolipoyl dehydrogenase [Gammaproteobacteria bacterium]MCP4277425.1 dihydrolipoyl dehydrogenase [Gammaproteobacteria bacterium]MCP4831514.1 dihydrolipoyl dehydrogenase [Gammaproteobacteria bacterium]MCP4927737.1 dihydrolipoyl dehydrogenase [Gammaproteobacteria bacterium]